MRQRTGFNVGGKEHTHVDGCVDWSEDWRAGDGEDWNWSSVGVDREPTHCIVGSASLKYGFFCIEPFNEQTFHFVNFPFNEAWFVHRVVRSTGVTTEGHADEQRKQSHGCQALAHVQTNRFWFMKTMATCEWPSVPSQGVFDEETHQHEAEGDGDSVDASFGQEPSVLKNCAKEAVHLTSEPTYGNDGQAEDESSLQH